MLDASSQDLHIQSWKFPTLVEHLSERRQPGLEDVARPERGPDFPQWLTIQDVTSLVIRPHARVLGRQSLLIDSGRCLLGVHQFPLRFDSVSDYD